MTDMRVCTRLIRTAVDSGVGWRIVWAVFSLISFCPCSLHAYSIPDTDNSIARGIVKQIAIDPYNHHKLPVLKMLKRQIKNFRAGRKATLTLVFTANQPVDIHWFQLTQVNSEEMMYPILDGHPYYETSTLHAGDVTAATMVIPLHYHNEDHIFETILNDKNATMQYQLKTKLDRKIVYSLDAIDSAEWLVVPPHESHLVEKQTFQRHCRAYVRLATGGNALQIMYAQPVLLKSTDHSRPKFHKMVQTHDSGQEYHVEELGTMILEGKMHHIRYKTSHEAAVLDVKAKQPDTERAREGIYMCTIERLTENTYLDKFHLISYVTVGRHHSVTTLLPSKPRVEVVSCATSDFDLAKAVVVLTEGQVGCVRCRGYGYPRPRVEVYRKYSGSVSTNPELTLTNRKIAVSKYTNVAEAGIVEAIYVFRDADLSMAGAHICTASNVNGSESLFFEVKVRPKKH